MNLTSMMIDIFGKTLPSGAQLFTCAADGCTDWSERPDVGDVCSVHHYDLNPPLLSNVI